MNKVIDAMFIGEDGKFYSVKVSSGYYKGKRCLWVYFRGGACPYYGFETLSDNWSL